MRTLLFAGLVVAVCRWGPPIGLEFGRWSPAFSQKRISGKQSGFARGPTRPNHIYGEASAPERWRNIARRLLGSARHQTK